MRQYDRGFGMLTNKLTCIITGWNDYKKPRDQFVYHLREMEKKSPLRQPTPVILITEDHREDLKRRALVIVLTDLADSMTSRSLLRSLHSFTGHHRVMVVAISDEALIRQAAEMPTTTYDACKKGVAMDLAALRQQALAALSKNRQTIVLDTTPDKLDDALLAQYLRLKERSQL